MSHGNEISSGTTYESRCSVSFLHSLIFSQFATSVLLLQRSVSHSFSLSVSLSLSIIFLISSPLSFDGVFRREEITNRRSFVARDKRIILSRARENSLLFPFRRRYRCRGRREGIAWLPRLATIFKVKLRRMASFVDPVEKRDFVRAGVIVVTRILAFSNANFLPLLSLSLSFSLSLSLFVSCKTSRIWSK